MKRFVLVLLYILGNLSFIRCSYSQGTFAPLYLLITGAGNITPLQDGQLLEVGQSYQMTAIPDFGYVFDSWQPVNVFVLTSSEIDFNTDPPSTNSVVSINFSPVPDYSGESVLNFTMQPETELYNMNGNSLTTANGWQANFVPVPEPSSTVLMVCGFAGFVLLCRWRFKMPNKSPEPTPVGAVSSASRFTVSGPAWLSFIR